MSNDKESSDLLGQRRIRIKKVETLRELGFDPYPSESTRTHLSENIHSNFENLENETVSVVGRVSTIREHGGLVFIDVEDESGKIQLYIKQDEMHPSDTNSGNLGFDNINLIDIGDFIQANGYVTKTNRGEISVTPSELIMLEKSIRPIPTEIEDKEERFRRRYVDMVVHPEVRHRFIRRAKFWQAHREFFNSRGFHEVNIPILEHIPGGGDAVPFKTHMNAINEDFYLRISHELPLKRLVGGGFEKVYDIGARFRNEGLSDEHLPEHVAMEFYWAYANWEDGMNFIEELFKHIIDSVYGGKYIFNIRGFEVDFSKKWEKIDFNQIMKESFGISDIYNVEIEEVIKLLKDNNIEFDEKTINIPRGIDSLWKQIRKTIAGPAFLINHPKYLSPLQKPSKVNPKMVERFQPIIAGSELGNGWSEVNDAIDQYERFIEQQEMRDSGDDEAQWLDIDYVEMLEYGMPPTFGYGHSERVFWFLEDVTAREGVPFPQMKYHVSEVTKKIYPEVDLENINRSIVDDEIDHKSIELDKITFNKDLVIIDNSVREEFTGIKTGFIVVENVIVSKNNSELEKLKEVVSSKVKNQFKNQSEIKENTNIKGFRELYKAFGADPNSTLNSAEALMRRVVKGKGIYNINNVVDTYNVTSIEFAIPMAAYNLDAVDAPIILRKAEEKDQITKILEEKPTDVPKGSLCYSDKTGVICMNYNYRDSDRTKITNETDRIIVFVDGHNEITEEYIKKVLGIVGARIEDFTGGNVTEYGVIN